MYFVAPGPRYRTSPGRFGWRQLNAKAFIATHFHDGEPVWRPHLAQHAMHVVLYRLFGKVQPARHFLVGKSLLNQPHQLLLSAAEAQAGLEVQVRDGRLMPRYPLEERDGECCRAHRFACGDCANSASYLPLRSDL